MNNNEKKHTTRLTAPELASLWTQYMTDSLDICMKKYVLEKLEDPQIRNVVEYASSISQNHIVKVKEFFNQENHPIPIGFTDDDVYVDAPRLFSDPFWLLHIHTMSNHGLTGYSLALTTATRSDIRDYYVQCTNETMELYNKSLDVLLAKGLFVRPPYITPAEQVDYVQRQNFLTGWLGDRRPLTAIEIAHINFNMRKNILVQATTLAFSQAAKLKEVREFMSRVEDVASNHIEVFRSILEKDDLPSPPSWQSDVTTSSIPPFSDKLMMFHVVQLINYAISYYGAALSNSMRRDLGANYTKVIAKNLTLAEDGANIMIANGWLEQPPKASDRKELEHL